MIYNGSNGDSLIEDISFRTGADLTQFLIADRNRYINEAYSRVASIILKADGRMQWDDPNHTDAPTSSCGLIQDQKGYSIFSSAPTALQDWLTIERVEIEDSSGNGLYLKMLDEQDLRGISINEYQKVSAVPTYFDISGTQIKLYPPPNYSRTNALKFIFKRAPSYFAVTDTTKRPGFATIFHQYLSIYTSHQWNFTKKKDGSLQPILTQMENDIGLFYAKRPGHVEAPRLSGRRPILMR